MMLLKVIAIGKLKDRAFQTRCDEYAKWLTPYAKLDIRILPDSNVVEEGKAILHELDKERSAHIIVLSEEGKQFPTADFASYLNRLDCKCVFVIGGPYGLDASVKKRANLLWSLSPLTFTHEIARLLLFEQLFRCLNLNAGGHYHNP
ncbi:MAG: 23S rRNA (pseudouridine(1915)-N(3))-methyltransferase RlmH [Victivallales bacterium]|nr:23S rRNA (pseudouridine(1915)-N(3))-methyltransferase RlmH [Victivallales bacterium]